MAKNVTTFWSPPPTSALNFSNCNTTSAFLASSVTAGETFDTSVAAMLKFLRALLPSNWTDSNITDGDLLLWSESWENETYDYIYDEVFDLMENHCHGEICQFLQLEGDPDLAGIGMMVSYYLLAVMAIFYVTVISLDSIEALNAYKPWKRLHGLIQQTLNSFLDSALLFSISMLLASTYRFASAFRHPDKDDNTFIYSLINAATLSMFSVFPPLILQFGARGLRRRGIRAILWFHVTSFAIAVTVLYYIWRGPHRISKYFENQAHEVNQIDRHLGPALWLSFCDSNNQRLIDALDRAIIIAQILLGLNLPGWVYFLFTLRDAQQDSAAPQGRMNNGSFRKAWKRYGKQARALNIILCCATMLLLLAIFTVIAVHLANAMGPWGKDRRWSIGQVMTLATFAPLIIDWIAIMIDEPRRALEGKLPRGFGVVEVQQPEIATNATVPRRFAFYKTGGPSEYEMLAGGAGTPRRGAEN